MALFARYALVAPAALFLFAGSPTTVFPQVLTQAAAAAQSGLTAAAALEGEFESIWENLLLKSDFNAGLEALEALLSRCRSNLGEGAPTTLKVRYFLGSTLYRIGRLADAKAEFEATLRQHEQAGTQDSRNALSSLAGLARAVEELEGARVAFPLYERALAQRSRTLGDDDLESVTLLDDYAGALIDLGEVHAALPMIEQVLAMRTKGLGSEHRWTITTLNSRGNALTRLGRHAEALADFEAVLRVRMRTLGERDPATLNAMSNTGIALANVGQPEEALKLHQRAFELRKEILGQNHLNTLATGRALGSGLRDLGRIGEALASFRALAVQGASVWGPTHTSTLLARVSMAECLELLGDLEGALSELEALHDLHVQAYGADHFRTIGVVIQRSRVLRALGRSAQARETMMTAVNQVAERYGSRIAIHAEAVAELAACHIDSGDPASASQVLSALLSGANAFDATETDALRAQRSEWRRLHVRALAQRGQVEEGFLALEVQKSARLIASLGERSAAESAGIPQLEIAGLQDARERVALLREAVRDARDVQDRQQRLMSLEKAILDEQRIHDGLRQQYPVFAGLTRLRTAGVSEAVSLPRDALLISYVVERGVSIGAITLDSKGAAKWQRLGDSPGLPESVESLRLWTTQLGRSRFADDRGRVSEIVHWMDRGHPRWRVVRLDALGCENAAESPDCRPAQGRVVTGQAEYDTLRQHLASLLLKPLEPRLSQYGHWVISPDKGLGSLPFDVLPWKGRTVAEHVSLSQVQSLSALMLSRKSLGVHIRSVDLVAFGNSAPIAFDDNGASGIQAALAPMNVLPGVELEVQSVATTFPANRTIVALGPAATEAHLRAMSESGALAGARHVLLAAHAWYDPARPGRTHLRLRATGATPKEDGRITATELAGLRLDSELFVISACNTARGESSSADGQFGFAYGLAVAGNQNALLTLWPVKDAASAAFVSRFFGHLTRDRQSHAAALYATKREFMKHPRAEWRHPSVWAGFVLFGA